MTYSGSPARLRPGAIAASARLRRILACGLFATLFATAADAQVVVDFSVLDTLGRDPYATASGQRTPARPSAPTAPRAVSPPRAPQAGGPLPPPSPAELEKRQAQINAAVRNFTPDPAAAPPRAAAPEKPVTLKQPPAKGATAKKTEPPAVAEKPKPAKQSTSKQTAAKPAKTEAPPPEPPKPAPAAPRAAPTPPPAPAPAPPVAATAEPAPVSVPPLPASVPPLPTASLPVTTPPPAAAPALPPPATSAQPAPQPSPPPATTAPSPTAPAGLQARVRPAAPPPAPPAPVAAPAAPAQPAAPPVRMAARPPEPPPPPPAATPVSAPAAAPAALPATGKAAARVGFLPGSSDLPEAAKTSLKAVADQMNRDAEMRVQLMAYAGAKEDTASQARRLSLFRALAVRSYLIEQGIRSTRMDVRALGNKVDDEPSDRVDVVIADR